MLQYSIVYAASSGKFTGKRPCGRHKSMWEDIVKMILKKLGCGEKWTEQVWDRI
jgi:hypothetical protein